MNLIFLTLSSINEIEERGIYADLMRKFRDEGHIVYIVSPTERRFGQKTHLQEVNGIKLLKVRTLNIQKTNIVEKGLGTLLIDGQFQRAIHRYFRHVLFDLILYSTPPITFTNTIKNLKRKNHNAISYLLLKDIFPQNAVDLGIMSKSGLFYRFFRRKEKKLYALSDFIGCMSPANVEYVLKHNTNLDATRVEVAPNSVELQSLTLDPNQLEVERCHLRAKYHIPLDVPVFIYGGNLGKPQGIPFLIECLEANANRDDCHFVIIGTGTELPKLKSWYSEKHPKRVTVMDGLPKDEYDLFVRACDVGLLFLDHRFTIPNFPSRLLSYLENKLPVICATDPNSDIGRISEENGFGYWCESDSIEDFTVELDRMIHSDRKAMGENGFAFLRNNYLVENTYNAIVKHV